MGKLFDYCTIIGRSPEMLEHHVSNVVENAGLDRNEWNFHVVVYKNSRIPQSVTDKILSFCKENNIYTHPYQEIEGVDYETFLRNLYACWNKCQEVGPTPLNVRAGSDQAFSKNAFRNMMDHWESLPSQNCILFHNLIECKSRVGGDSRHILEDFGDSWDSFNSIEFQDWCDSNEVDELVGFERANELWGAPRNMPGLISNGRADGASWIQTKALFKKYGPMPPRYPNGLTGDIGLMEKMRACGVQFFIIGDSTSYHISRGEAESR